MYNDVDIDIQIVSDDSVLCSTESNYDIFMKVVNYIISQISDRYYYLIKKNNSNKSKLSYYIIFRPKTGDRINEHHTICVRISDHYKDWARTSKYYRKSVHEELDEYYDESKNTDHVKYVFVNKKKFPDISDSLNYVDELLAHIESEDFSFDDQYK